MKGVIEPPRSTCVGCTWGQIMDRPSGRAAFCSRIKQFVPPDITACSTFYPIGGQEPTWGGDVYAKGVVVDPRPPGQYA